MTAGIEPDLGPLATAYVLILVIVGPLAARWTEPAAGRLAALRARRWVPVRQRGAAQPAPDEEAVEPVQS